MISAACNLRSHNLCGDSCVVGIHISQELWVAGARTKKTWALSFPVPTVAHLVFRRPVQINYEEFVKMMMTSG